MHKCVLCVSLAVSVVLVPNAARAQNPPAAGPPVAPSLLLPNYNRVLMGEREALESGAFTARAEGAVATFYNPAGLGLATKSRVTAGLSTQEWMNYSVSTEAASTARLSNRSLGGVFGVVLGPEVAGLDKWRFAFLIMRPVSFAPALELRASGQAGDATQSSTWVTTGSLSDFAPSVAAAYNYSPTLRLGGSVRVSSYTLYQSQSLLIDDISPAGLRTSDSLLFSDGGVWSLILTGGVQWDVTPRFRVGAHVTLPSIRMAGSSSVIYRGAIVGAAAGLLETFADPNVTFNYRQPFSVAGGAAWTFARGAIEFDVRQYAGTGDYDRFTTNVPIERIVVTTQGTTVSQLAFPATDAGAQAVTNVAFGGSYRLSTAVTAHGGFFTDRSPIGSGPNSVFARMNLAGVTAGASLRFTRMSGSAGISYITGESAIDVATPRGAVQPTLRVKSLQLFYAISIAF